MYCHVFRKAECLSIKVAKHRKCHTLKGCQVSMMPVDSHSLQHIFSSCSHIKPKSPMSGGSNYESLYMFLTVFICGCVYKCVLVTICLSQTTFDMQLWPCNHAHTHIALMRQTVRQNILNWSAFGDIEKRNACSTVKYKCGGVVLGHALLTKLAELPSTSESMSNLQESWYG